MDIQDYVRQEEKVLVKRARRLRDMRIFDWNYIPPRVFLREELKPVIDALLRYEKTGIGNHLLVIGSRGCGKTLGVRYLQKIFEDRSVSVLYVNCRIHNTSYKVLASLLGVRARGLSFSELAERFADRYPAKTVVLLDEVDLLSDGDKKKDIFYFLSRSRCNFMTIMLSNSPKWVTALDESIQSTLQPELRYFRPYTPPEIEEILADRARLGIRGSTGSILRKIAALTTKYTNSDVRVAIKTLYYWATGPGTPLDEHFQRARRDIVIDVIGNLNDKNLLILKSATGAERPVKEVYERYRRLCAQHREEPFSYVYFYSGLSYLQSLGLVLLTSTKVRRAYTKIIHLTFQIEILDTVWGVRFE